MYKYAATIAALVDACDDRLPLGLRELEGFVNRPRRGGRTAAPATRAREVATLRSFYGWAHALAYVERNPTVLLGAPKVANENPRPIADDVWRHVWALPMDDELRVVLGLGYFAGLRRREMCELLPAHVDVDGQRLVNFKRKGGGDDVLPYGELADLLGGEDWSDAFEAWAEKRAASPYLLSWGEWKPRGSLAFPGEMTDPQTVNKRLRALFRDWGLPEDAFTPHALRHSFVTNLLRLGVPLHLVSKLANHTSSVVTGRYFKVSGFELAEWRRAVPRLALSEFPQR